MIATRLMVKLSLHREVMDQIKVEVLRLLTKVWTTE